MVRHLGPLPSVFLTQAAHQPADVVHHSSPVVSGISLTAAVPREQPGQGGVSLKGWHQGFHRLWGAVAVGRGFPCGGSVSIFHFSILVFTIKKKNKMGNVKKERVNSASIMEELLAIP